MFERSQEKSKISRRDFLRGAAASGGALALSNIANLFLKERAYAVEVKDGMTWEEGIAALKRDVFNAKNETKAIYVEGTRVGWREPRDMGIIQGTSEDVALDGAFFQKLISEDAELRTIRPAHVHAIASLIHTKHVPENIKEMLAQGNTPTPLAPPSLPDMLLHIWNKKRYMAEGRVTYEDVTLDPSGIWYTSLPTEGTFSRNMFEYLVLVREKIPTAIGQTGLSQDAQDKLLACIKNFDEKCVEESDSDAVKELFLKYRQWQASGESVFAPAEGYQNYVLGLQTRSTTLSDAERKEYITKIIGMAKGMNIELRFEPYEKETGY